MPRGMRDAVRTSRRVRAANAEQVKKMRGDYYMDQRVSGP